MNMNQSKGLQHNDSYNAEELAFLEAMNEFEAKSGHKFPTWTEILGVVRSMGFGRDR